MRGKGLGRDDPLNTSWKLSRARAAILVAAVHVLLAYFFLGSTRATPEAPSVTPIVVSLIYQPRRPIEVPATIYPKLVKVQIRPPPIPDFRIDVPAEPTPSPRADKPVVESPAVGLPDVAPPVAGSPGLRGSINQAGGPLTLNVIRYVAPEYSPGRAGVGEHGAILMALLVDSQGRVDKVKILRGTGWLPLDQAAVRAVRQWKFAADKSGARSAPVWGEVQLRFSPPQRVLRVPIIMMPYTAIARNVDAAVATNRARPAELPSGEVSVRSLLQKLIAAYPSGRAQEPGTTRDATADSAEAELGLWGPIQSLKFLGFVEHGIAIDQDRSDSPDAPDSPDFRDPPQLKTTHWEAYDVEQDHGSSVWLVAVTAGGSIQRIEVAVR